MTLVGASSLLLGLVHVFGGGRDVLRPMLRADFDPVARATMHACWHAITVYLFATGAILLWRGLAPPAGFDPLAATIFASYAAVAAVFVLIVARTRVPAAWRRLPQWIPFSIMGVAGLATVL
ncbi:MAG: hypothetical protein AAF721_34240 [Myxococcota bacterium]